MAGKGSRHGRGRPSGHAISAAPAAGPSSSAAPSCDLLSSPSDWPTPIPAAGLSSPCQSKPTSLSSPAANQTRSAAPIDPAGLSRASITTRSTDAGPRAAAQGASGPVRAAAAEPPDLDARQGEQPLPLTFAEAVKKQPSTARERSYTLSDMFYGLLNSNRVYYEDQLNATASLNKIWGRSEPYYLKFSYSNMWEMKADVDLIRAASNSRTNIDRWLLPIARQFVRKFLSDNDYLIEESTINGTRLSFSDFPERMQMLEDFRKNHPLVQHVPIIGRKTYILAPTFHGCRCMEILMVGILENHHHGISWGGEFSEENILIIEWKSKSHRVDTRDSSHYEMKILQKPVDSEGQSLREAMVRDLCKTAEIFIPFYRVGDHLPVHFLELKEELEGAKEVYVGKVWYMKYLTHHPAIMPSAGRRTFLTYLHHALLDCNNPLGNIMATKPTADLNDWKTVVQSEVKGKKWGDRNTITVLQNVYYYNKKPGTEYGSSQRELVRFIRNVHEHGKEHDASVISSCELELYLAKKFSSFLPSILRTLLESGGMDHLQEAWSHYEVSKLLNLIGYRIKEDTNGQNRLYYV
ncbi:uncharacterized protein LOC119294477 [Triticum dicoccoides]|uniref:uncharacterized protein LOC119294477 n=1 Tax=Triticum dicoccoides TaxID=85692 RepID=UPI00188DDD31|nr:uncharacterized protein LOC119294477 [Triticum dicoccoides]